MTTIELRKTIKSLPITKRQLIKKQLGIAFMAISRAECILTELGFKDSNIPILENQYSLNSCVYNLHEVFDIEGNPDLTTKTKKS